MAERVIAVEIGSNITKVCETDYKGSPTLYSYFTFETPDDAFDGQKVKESKAFADLLTKGLLSHGIHTKKVVFLISVIGIGSKEDVIPQMREKQIQSYVETNLANFFPIDPATCDISYRINGKTEDGQQRIQLYVVDHEITDAYRALAKFCHLDFVNLTFAENGIAQALRNAYPTGNIVSVDVEDDYSSIAIFRDGEIALQRSISYGVVDIDAAVTNVRRILEYFESQNQGVTFEKLYCTGISTDGQDLIKLLSAETGQEFSMVPSEVYGKTPKKFAEKEVSSVFAMVVAAAYAKDVVKKSIYKNVPMEGRDLWLSHVVLVVCIVIAAMLVIYPVTARFILNRQKTSLETSIARMQEAKDVHDEMVEKENIRDELTEMLAETQTPNDALLTLFSEIESDMPTEAVIEQMNASSESVTFTFRVPTKEVGAKTIQVFRNFSTVDHISTTALLSTSTSGSDAYEFTLTCYYAGTYVSEDGEEEEEEDAENAYTDQELLDQVEETEDATNE